MIITLFHHTDGGTRNGRLRFKAPSDPKERERIIAEYSELGWHTYR